MLLLRLFLATVLALATSCQSPETLAPQTPKAADPSGKLDRLPRAGVYDNAQGSPVFEMIDGASTAIDIAAYDMSDATVRVALRRALNRGVTVRVIKEPNPVNDRCNLFGLSPENAATDCAEEKALKAEIISRGGAFIAFNKKELCADSTKPCYAHGKMIVADRRVALISTGNFSPTSLCNLPLRPSRCNRDFTVITREPEVVAFFQSVFDRDLQEKKYDLAALLKSSSLEERVTVSPLSLSPLIQFIQRAQDSILLHNQYLKDSTILAAIAEASGRGVRVRVTLASLCSFGPPSQRERARHTEVFSRLDEAGVSVRMIPSQFKIGGKPGYQHAKAIVIDGKAAWVGSVNGSTAALTNNREFGIFFENPDWVASLAQMMSDDHASRDTESWVESLNCALDKLDR